MLALLIGVLFAFMFGGMMLILYFGAQGVEGELQKREQAAREFRERATHVPRFLVVGQGKGGRTPQIDDALLWQVQQYLETEQTLADEFVLRPSIESLYRESGRRLVGH